MQPVSEILNPERMEALRAKMVTSDEQEAAEREAERADLVAQFVDAVARHTPPAHKGDLVPCEPVSRVAAWANAIGAQEAQRLILAGPTGTGKTRLAWYALQCAVAARCGNVSTEPDLRPDELNLFRFVTMIDLVRTPSEAKGPYRFLVIDDLGQEPAATDHAQETAAAALWDVLNYRWDHCLTTIVTTNLGGAKVPSWRNGQEPKFATILGRYGDAVWSRLQPSRVVTVVGADRRAPT